jgi:hypothetical protein
MQGQRRREDFVHRMRIHYQQCGQRAASVAQLRERGQSHRGSSSHQKSNRRGIVNLSERWAEVG